MPSSLPGARTSTITGGRWRTVAYSGVRVPSSLPGARTGTSTGVQWRTVAYGGVRGTTCSQGGKKGCSTEGRWRTAAYGGVRRRTRGYAATACCCRRRGGVRQLQQGTQGADHRAWWAAYADRRTGVQSSCETATAKYRADQPSVDGQRTPGGVREYRQAVGSSRGSGSVLTKNYRQF